MIPSNLADVGVRGQHATVDGDGKEQNFTFLFYCNTRKELVVMVGIGEEEEEEETGRGNVHGRSAMGLDNSNFDKIGTQSDLTS